MDGLTDGKRYRNGSIMNTVLARLISQHHAAAITKTCGQRSAQEHPSIR